MKKIGLAILFILAIIIISQCRQQMEKRGGPQVAPLFQTEVPVGSFTVQLSDPNILEKIRHPTIVVGDDFLKEIKEIANDSLESKTIFFDQ